MLELKTGEPWWYGPAVFFVLILLCLALLIEPLQAPFVFLLVGASLLIAWCDIRVRRDRSRFKSICVTEDFSVMLIDENGVEVPVSQPDGCWVTRQLILVRVETPDQGKMDMLVARSGNCPEAYRRFSVICRFGFAVDDPERHNVAQLNPKDA